MRQDRDKRGDPADEQGEEARFRSYFAHYESMIPDYEGFLRALASRHKRTVRINTLKAKMEECAAALHRLGGELTPCLHTPHVFVLEGLTHPGNTLEFALGHYTVQALSSALAVTALEPRPGECILDMCAAPGSKTSYLGQMMNNTGFIVANEKKRARLAPLAANLNRLGVANCVTTLYPGEHFPMKVSFDRVLADVPCSGEGRHRMHNRAPLDFSGGVKQFLMEVQKRIILRGFDLLRPGGTMLYSTCSYDPEENEAVVAYLLNNRPAVLREIPLKEGTVPGLTQWKDDVYGPELAKCSRIYPHRIDTVGFFMARVDKPHGV